MKTVVLMASCAALIAGSSVGWAATIAIGSRDSTQSLSFSDTSSFSDAAGSGTTVFSISGNAGDTLGLGYVEPHGATGFQALVTGPFSVSTGVPVIASPNDTYPINVTATGSPSNGTLTIKSQLGVNIAPVGAIETLSTGTSSGYHFLDEFYNPLGNQSAGQTFSFSVDIAGNYSGSGIGTGMHQLLSLNHNWTVTQNFVFNGTDTIFAATINNYDPIVDRIDLNYQIYGSPVPLPATVWLMVSGLGCFLALARTRRAA